MTRVTPACSVDPTAVVVEWSHIQGCMHIQVLGYMIDCNRAVAFNGFGEPTDYAVIGIFATAKEASDFARAMEPHLREARALRMARKRRPAVTP